METTARSTGGVVVSTDPAYTFTVTGDRTLTAVFEPIPVYTITAAIDPEGSGTVTGAGRYQEGETVTLTAEPADGYEFTGWQEGGQTVSESETYTFTVEADRVLVAAFEESTSRLPKGYTELQYIVSDSSCGIDTGVNINLKTDELTMVIEPTAYSAGTEMILDNSNNSTPRSQLIRGSATKIKRLWGTGNTLYSTEISIANIKTTISMKNGKLVIGSTTVTTVTTSMVTVGTLYLFWGVKNYSDAKSINAKLYSCQMLAAGVLVRDFVPCSDPSGEVGLFDIVNKKFYKNKKSGTFTAGPAV